MIFLKNYKFLVLVAFLLVFALIMLSYNTKYDTGRGFFRNIVLEAAAPVQNLMSASVKSVSAAWARYISLVGVVEENKSLNKKIGELEAELLIYKEGYLEAQRLQKLLALRDTLGYNPVPARVIAREQAALSKTIIIDKGAIDGLMTGMPVVAPTGAVGRLIDVSWNVSKVLLLIDENNNMDAMLQRTRVQGIFSGAGFRGGILKYITKNHDVAEGDTIISSGMGGVFPKGLLIGTVRQVEKQDADLFLKIKVAPLIDFSKLEEVLVLASEEKGGK